jgi:hypothetical protein
MDELTKAPENAVEELENTELENAEMTELEEKDLEDVSGGETLDGNTGCNCNCSET